jgi:hypothetical protein
MEDQTVKGERSALSKHLARQRVCTEHFGKLNAGISASSMQAFRQAQCRHFDKLDRGKRRHVERVISDW